LEKLKSEWIDLLESIKRSTQNSTSLTRQLLTFGKNQITELGVLDLGQVIFEFHSILANALGKDIDFRVHVEKPLWKVLAHRMHVELLLTNLCFNARDSFLGARRMELIVKNVHINSEAQDAQEFWRIGLPRGDYI